MLFKNLVIIKKFVAISAEPVTVTLECLDDCITFLWSDSS